VRSLALALLLLGLAGGSASARPEHHTRLKTKHGAVHLWTPAGYEQATAATVVYIHGYYTDVDHAWVRHRLARQFRASGLNALFIAIEAPAGDNDGVYWESLEDLLDTVSQSQPVPTGRLIAIAHSGGHRTVTMWLDDPFLDTIALVDAAYNHLELYASWLDASEDHRLIDVGDLTRNQTDAFHSGIPETLVIDRFPKPERGALPDEALHARVVYIKSNMGHMELVTRGIAIPMILRSLAAPLVAEHDRSAPLRPTG